MWYYYYDRGPFPIPSITMHGMENGRRRRSQCVLSIKSQSVHRPLNTDRIRMTSSAPTSSLAIGASFARKASVAAAHIHMNSRRVASPTTRFATSTAVTNNLTNNNRSTKLHSFRQIINSRTSARRFQPNTPIPNSVWKDILSMTLVSG